jgi:hypothetical protein
MCNPASCAGLHTHIRDTSPDRDMRLSGIRVVELCIISVMEHTILKADNSVLFKDSCFKNCKIK